MRIRPLGDRLIVKAVEEEETSASGIVLPDTAGEKPQKGKVLAVGDGKVDDSGQRVPLDVYAGDEVLYERYGGTTIQVDGEDLLVLRESDLLAAVPGARPGGDAESRATPLPPGASSEIAELREAVAEDIERLKHLAG